MAGFRWFQLHYGWFQVVSGGFVSAFRGFCKLLRGLNLFQLFQVIAGRFRLSLGLVSTIFIPSGEKLLSLNLRFFNPFHTTGLFLYPLKTSENFTVSSYFQGL